MARFKSDKESNQGVGRGFIRRRPLDNPSNQTYLSSSSIFESLPYPAAPLSSPSAGYGRDAEIRMKELEPIKENFRNLNQRLQKMGYKLIKSRYGWYWMKRA